MTITLTDNQINEIFDGFDWYDYTRDYIDQDFLNDYLNDHSEMFFDYLDYGMSFNIKKKFEEWQQSNL